MHAIFTLNSNIMHTEFAENGNIMHAIFTLNSNIMHTEFAENGNGMLNLETF
jgi:hypothetical protein